MPELPYEMERTVVIRATPETVFRYFTDSARWASWWGAGSAIEAQPGGRVYIRHPNGVETLGEVVELRPPEHIVFTYGYASGSPILPGGSRVAIRLEPDAAGTRLTLRHEFGDAGVRDHHVQGWRFQLSQFANAVANEVYAGASAVVDRWFALWTTPDDSARAQQLAEIVDPEIRFRDRFSLLAGVDDLNAHMGAAQRFMPGTTLARKSEVRHCQGTVLADWIATGPDGKERISGTSVFTFAPDRRIVCVVSVTNPA